MLSRVLSSVTLWCHFPNSQEPSNTPFLSIKLQLTPNIFSGLHLPQDHPALGFSLLRYGWLPDCWAASENLSGQLKASWMTLDISFRLDLMLPFFPSFPIHHNVSLSNNHVGWIRVYFTGWTKGKDKEQWEVIVNSWCSSTFPDAKIDVGHVVIKVAERNWETTEMN